MWLTIGLMTLFVLCLFLPWTQNIQSKGKVTTVNPGQRPQSIESTIAGRIEKWYVREGQFVKIDDLLFCVDVGPLIIEVASSQEGIVKEMLVVPGQPVEPGLVATKIDISGVEPIGQKLLNGFSL